MIYCYITKEPLTDEQRRILPNNIGIDIGWFLKQYAGVIRDDVSFEDYIEMATFGESKPY